MDEDEYAFQLFQIRDMAEAKLLAAGVCGGNVQKSRIMPWGEDELDGDGRVNVYLRGVSMQSVGAVRPLQFDDRVQIAVQIGRRANSAAAVEAALETEAKAALGALLTDAEFLDLFEEVPSVELAYDVPETGKGYEAQALILLTGTYTTIWRREHVDDFLRLRGLPPEHGIDVDPDEEGAEMGFSVDLDGAGN